MDQNSWRKIITKQTTRGHYKQAGGGGGGSEWVESPLTLNCRMSEPPPDDCTCFLYCSEPNMDSVSSNWSSSSSGIFLKESRGSKPIELRHCHYDLSTSSTTTKPVTFQRIETYRDTSLLLQRVHFLHHNKTRSDISSGGRACVLRRGKGGPGRCSVTHT